jgi:ribosomal-protein-alanine N-acetyltransferase
MTPDALAALHARCFARPAPWSARSFADLLASPRVFLISRPQQGFALGRLVLEDCELLTIATDPDARRQGVARAILTEFLLTAAGRGAAQVHLEVAADNAPARALYAAFGFAETGRRPGYYAATRTEAASDALNLCKAL